MLWGDRCPWLSISVAFLPIYPQISSARFCAVAQKRWPRLAVCWPAATRRRKRSPNNNERFYKPHVAWTGEISDEMKMLLYTPETSGGLLVAVPSPRLEVLTTRFATEGEPCWVIGEVLEGEGIEVTA